MKVTNIRKCMCICIGSFSDVHVRSTVICHEINSPEIKINSILCTRSDPYVNSQVASRCFSNEKVGKGLGTRNIIMLSQLLQ